MWTADYIPGGQFMEVAIREALEGVPFGEHPVGAVVVLGDQVLGSSGNRTHRDVDPTRHAEIVAIGRAANLLANKNLSGSVLYTTHEPCPMCASAVVFARMSGVVFGTTVRDAYEFVVANPTVNWRSIQVPITRVITESDQASIFVHGGFMRERCLELFGELLSD